jgi:hypothetical protein
MTQMISKEKYCENCENFSIGKQCEYCQMEFIEPEWLDNRGLEMQEILSREVNGSLL